jgi:hypothetical protein
MSKRISGAMISMSGSLDIGHRHSTSQIPEMPLLDRDALGLHAHLLKATDRQHRFPLTVLHALYHGTHRHQGRYPEHNP